MWHNKEHGKPHLLNLPTHVRLRILEEVLVVPDDNAHNGHVVVCARAKGLSAGPALTRTCWTLRRCGRPIFYRGNSFVVQVWGCDFGFLISWVGRRDRFRFAEWEGEEEEEEEERGRAASSSTSIQLQELPFDVASFEEIWWCAESIAQGRQSNPEAWDQAVERLSTHADALASKHLQRSTKRKQHGDLAISLLGPPDWGNLVVWLKLAHSGEAMAFMKGIGEERSSVEMAVSGAFKIVMGLGEQEWGVVEKALFGVREMSGAADCR